MNKCPAGKDGCKKYTHRGDYRYCHYHNTLPNHHTDGTPCGAGCKTSCNQCDNTGVVCIPGTSNPFYCLSCEKGKALKLKEKPGPVGEVTQTGYICKDCGYLIPNKYGKNLLPDKSQIWHRPIPASEGQYMASVENVGVKDLVACNEVAGLGHTIRALEAENTRLREAYRLAELSARGAISIIQDHNAKGSVAFLGARQASAEKYLANAHAALHPKEKS